MKYALHGFTGSPDVWQDFPCHPLTVLGHGPGVVANGSESFSSETHRLYNEMSEPCKGLIGYSMGARLALAMALRFPGKFPTLTLIGVNPGLSNQSLKEQRSEQDSYWSTLLRQEGIHQFTETWQKLPLWNSQKKLSPERLDSQQKQRLRHNPHQLAHALDVLGTGKMPSLWNTLHSLTSSLTLVVGEKDTKYLHIASLIQEALPQTKLCVVPDCGHNVVLECPGLIQELLTNEKEHNEHF